MTITPAMASPPSRSDMVLPGLAGMCGHSGVHWVGLCPSPSPWHSCRSPERKAPEMMGRSVKYPSFDEKREFPTLPSSDRADG